jgi:hypothetical protein
MRFNVVGMVLCGMLVCCGAAVAAPADSSKVLDGFLASVEKSSTATADQKRIIGQLVEQLRKTPEDRAAAINESLRVLFP